MSISHIHVLLLSCAISLIVFVALPSSSPVLTHSGGRGGGGEGGGGRGRGVVPAAGPRKPPSCACLVALVGSGWRPASLDGIYRLVKVEMAEGGLLVPIICWKEARTTHTHSIGEPMHAVSLATDNLRMNWSGSNYLFWTLAAPGVASVRGNIKGRSQPRPPRCLTFSLSSSKSTFPQPS